MDSTAQRQHAFHTYVEPQIEVLLRVAQTLTGSWADSEDLVQDTLVRAYRESRASRYASAGVAYLRFCDTPTSTPRRQRSDLAPEITDLDGQRPTFGGQRPAFGAASPEQTVTDQVLDDSVETALAALDPKFRAVLLLIDVDQLTYAEVAELLGIPVGTGMPLARARGRSAPTFVPTTNSGEADDVLALDDAELPLVGAPHPALH